MCAAVVGEVRTPNVTFTCSVLAVGSRNTVANPAPGVLTAGTSFAPERLVVNVIGIAYAAGAGSIMAAATNTGKGMSALSVTIFPRYMWKIVAVKVELRYASCPFCQNTLASIF